MPRKYEKCRLIKADTPEHAKNLHQLFLEVSRETDTPEYAKKLLQERDVLLKEAQRRGCSTDLFETYMRAKLQGGAHAEIREIPPIQVR